MLIGSRVLTMQTSHPDDSAPSIPAPSLPTLLDVVNMVPPVLEACVSACNPRGACIRALRLVSLDFSRMAGSAVRNCSVQVGVGAYPTALQWKRLLGSAALRQMDITVITRAGMTSELDQLNACILQARQLVNGMPLAFSGLTHLHLTVRLVLHNHDRVVSTFDSTFSDDCSSLKYKEGVCTIHMEGKCDRDLYSKICKQPNLAKMPLTVFEIISAAVPNLQHLSLLGYCRDGALQAFGAKCPDLHSLTCEASSVPPTILANLYTYIPGLATFEVMKRGASGSNLQQFASASFAALSYCSNLTSLNFNLSGNVEIKCSKNAWQALPVSLLNLRSSCTLKPLRSATSMFQTLQHVDLVESPYNQIFELLKVAPCLRSLTVSDKASLVLDSQMLIAMTATLQETTEMLEHLSVVRLSCPVLTLKASSDDMQVMLSYLSPNCCNKVTLQVCNTANTQVMFMQWVEQVFPFISILEIVDRDAILNPPPVEAGWKGQCLGSLTGCTWLRELTLRLPMSLSTAGILQMFLGIPTLQVLRCYPCLDLNYKDLKQKLSVQSPGCNVHML